MQALKDIIGKRVQIISNDCPEGIPIRQERRNVTAVFEKAI